MLFRTRGLLQAATVGVHCQWARKCLSALAARSGQLCLFDPAVHAGVHAMSLQLA